MAASGLQALSASDCPYACHHHGTCWGYDAEKNPGAHEPICVCSGLFAGKFCSRRKHNPWNAQLEKKQFDEWQAKMGAVCDTVNASGVSPRTGLEPRNAKTYVAAAPP